jgi:general secretion pathway protein D
MMRARLAIAASVLLLSACQNKNGVLDPLPPLAENSGVASERASGVVAAEARTQAAPEISTGRPIGFTSPHLPSGGKGGDVSLNFADTDLREIVRQVLGGILQVNYSIDPSVHGTASIETVKPLRRAELLPTLQLLLEQNGATLVQSGDLYRVIPTAAAAASPTVGTDATAGTQMAQLRYASARELAKVLEPFIGEGARVVADPTRNVLLVSGEPQARATLMGLIRSFDIDLLAGQSFAVFPVSNGDPGKVAGELQKVFQTEGDGALAGVVRVVPMERVNAVLVVSSQSRYIDDARRLFNLVDQARKDTARSWHVYYVQNGQSMDIANVLQRAFTPQNVTAQPGGGPGSTAPGLGGQTLGGQSGGSGFGQGGASGGIGGGQGVGGTGGIGGSSGIGGSGGGTGGLGGTGGTGGLGSQSGFAQQQGIGGGQAGDQGNGPAQESLSAASPEQGAEQANTIRIIPHRQNNAVLIFATPEEESTIEAMLHKIDIIPLQVRIDATIAEVTLNDNLRYGTQFFFKDGGINGTLSGVASGAIAGQFAGFVLSKGSSAVQFALSALQSVTNVRVLSSPQLLVLDNQPARLQVGDLVPFLTSTSVGTITTTGAVTNTVGYQETGVILEILPRVNSGGLVTLDVSQEVSDVDTANQVVGIQSPTFLERKVRSRVVIQDGQTIGLAGLIRDNTSRSNNGIPFLKDIPILGLAFGEQDNTRQRTELLVMITPHVIQDQRDARALTEDLRQKLPHAGLVPQQLQNLPLQGSANPNGALTE